MSRRRHQRWLQQGGHRRLCFKCRRYFISFRTVPHKRIGGKAAYFCPRCIEKLKGYGVW